jgi:hypothetical protein
LGRFRPGQRFRSSVIGQAEDELKRPIAETPDELYLDFSQTGNRRRYEARLSARRHRMGILALAECLESRGRFLGELEKTITAICQEKNLGHASS